MVAYLITEDTDDEVIDGYTDTLFNAAIEYSQAYHKKKMEEGLEKAWIAGAENWSKRGGDCIDFFTWLELYKEEKR